MLYDVAVLIPEAMTAELTGTLMDAFSYASPSLGRSSDGQDMCELYVTYEAHDFVHATRVVVEGLDGICDMESLSIDLVNGDGHRPPPLHASL